MISIRSIVLGAAFTFGIGAAADAQVPYAYPYPYVSPAQALPPSYNYNPYTSGLSPCPQKRPGDLGKCGDQMPATYGQPDYAQHTYPPAGNFPWWYQAPTFPPITR